MRIVRFALAATAALALVSTSYVGLATPAHALPSGPGIGWQYSSTANGYWRPPQPTSPGGGSGGPATVWIQRNGTNEVHCDENDPAFWCLGGEGVPDNPTEIMGILCGSALRGPRGLPLFGWIRWERAILPDGTPDRWIGKDAGCDEPGEEDFVPMERITEIATADVFHGLNLPLFVLKPAPQGLVNLPVIVSTTYPDPADNTIAPVYIPGSNPVQIRIPVVVEKPGPDFVGEITAQAGNYVWTFNDGGEPVAEVSGRGPGRTYTPGVDPRTNPNYYVSHTYREPGVGKTVTLTVTWTGRVRVPGVNVDEAIDPVSITNTSIEFSVVEAKPVLGKR